MINNFSPKVSYRLVKVTLLKVTLVKLMLLLGFAMAQTDTGYAEGRVLERSSNSAIIRLSNGQEIEAQIALPFNQDPTSMQTLNIKVGQQVELYYSPNPSGGMSYVVVDWIRRPVLLWLTLLFLVVAVVVAGFKGLRAFLATGLSLVIVIFYIVPQIVQGQNPLLVSLVGVGGILILAIYFVHGLSWNTTAALIGTFCAVLVTMLLGILFSDWAYLTGYGSEDAMMINLSASQIDLKGLMLAGLLVGALGALTDITIVQASVVRELAFVNPSLTIGKLYKGGMNVGYDHIGSLVNTLVLAYTGSALPLLLLLHLNNFGLNRALNIELVATEVIHTLVGSIGLILAVPLTTFIAGLMFQGNRLPMNPQDTHGHHHHH